MSYCIIRLRSIFSLVGYLRVFGFWRVAAIFTVRMEGPVSESKVSLHLGVEYTLWSSCSMHIASLQSNTLKIIRDFWYKQQNTSIFNYFTLFVKVVSFLSFFNAFKIALNLKKDDFIRRRIVIATVIMINKNLFCYAFKMALETGTIVFNDELILLPFPLFPVIHLRLIL